MNLFFFTLFLGFVSPNMEGQGKQPIQVNSGAGSLEMLVTGSGKPAVIFESGFDDTLEDWAGVTAVLSPRTTTVAYDRAGIGGSPMNAKPRTALQIAEELHTALLNAKIAPPYLLVGHSAGGMYVRVFAHLYPADVAGIVLVDPAPEGFYGLMARKYPDLWKAFLQQLQSSTSPGVRAQMVSNDKTVEQVSSAWPLPSVPITLLTATNIEPPVFSAQRREEFSSMQRELLQKIPGAVLKKATGCGHNIPVDCPTVVSNAVIAMLDMISSEQSSQPSAFLPDGPRAQESSAMGSASISLQTTSSIAGEVTDESGGAVSNALVTLSDEQGRQQRAAQSGQSGDFVFSELAAGSYQMRVVATGYEVFRSSPMIVAQGQSYPLAQIQLRIHTANIEVTVHPTDISAAEEIKTEEKQRVFGVIPNFYVSYIFDAAPLTAKQKFTLSLHDTFDPFNVVVAGAAAGIEQGNNTYPGYGKGAAGYGKRFGASYGDILTDGIFSNAIFPMIFHQDPRYFYQGTGAFRSRFIHAVSFAVLVRSDNGHSMLNYSFAAGDIASGALSNLYYPHADRGTSLIFTNAAISIGGRALGAIVREFLLKRITTNVPSNVAP